MQILTQEIAIYVYYVKLSTDNILTAIPSNNNKKRINSVVQ